MTPPRPTTEEGPRTEHGRSFIRWMADREHWHPIDGRRDVTLGYILAIEAEAAAPVPAPDPFDLVLLEAAHLDIFQSKAAHAKLRTIVNAARLTARPVEPPILDPEDRGTP